MGVKNCSSFLYKSQPVEFDHFTEVLFEIAKRNKREADLLPNTVDVYTPHIDLDANNVGFKDFNRPVNHISRIVGACGIAGISFTVVVDGDTRHHSKRASFARIAQREKDRLDSIEKEIELIAVQQENGASAQTEALAKEIEKKKKYANRKLPLTFNNDLQMCMAEAFSDCVTFQKSHLQADPVLARRNVMGLSDVVWSNDSDLIVHNPCCVLIHSYSLPQSGPIKNIILATGHARSAEMISNILNRHPQYRDKPVFKTPKQPLFDIDLQVT